MMVENIPIAFRRLWFTQPWDEGIQTALVRWAAFEGGRKEARKEEGEIEEKRDRELEWGRGDLE